MAIILLITILTDLTIQAGALDLDGILGIGIFILDGTIIILITMVITTIHMIIIMDMDTIIITTMQGIMMDITEEMCIMEEELQQDHMLEPLRTQRTEVQTQM